MKRILGLTIAVALCAGCRSQQPVYDPFLGPTTVPPPGTAAPPPGQPYYGAPPGAPPVLAPPPGAAPAPVLPRGGVPLNFAPAPAGGMSSSFTPNVSPQQLQPGAAPVLQPTPAGAPPGYAGSVASLPASAVRPVYGPPGGTGYAYPQAAAAPQYGTPTLAQPPNTMAQPTAAQSPAGGGVTPATHWEPAGQNSTINSSSSSGTPANSNGAGSLPTTAPNPSTPIRIVSPSAAASPPTNSTAAATSTLTSMGASSPTLNQSLNSTPPSAASSSAPNSTLVMARIPEITELPPASGYTPAAFTSTAQPAAAQKAATMAAANPAIANSAAGGQPAIPLTNYGYDSQYHWLKGKLEYSQSTNTWRLRYIPPDGVTDNYGGSVVLSDASKLNGLHPGDLVYAQGTPGAASGSQGSFAPLYNLAQIQKQ